MQISMFDLDCEKPYKIKKPIRLIELFEGGVKTALIQKM